MNFLVFDTEDNSKDLLSSGKSGFDKQVTQIAAITAGGEEYHNRGDRTAFLDWVLKRPEKFIYAHNLQYDLGNLFSDRLDALDVTLVGGRLIKAVWGKKIFVDSFNIWPMSVKKLAPAFGLEKLETQSMATDIDYVLRDCEIIRRAMAFAWAFCRPLGIDNLPSTLGGLCVKVWKAFGGENCHDSTLLAREALFGGRVELFKICNAALWKLNDPALLYALFNNTAPPGAFDSLKFPRAKSVCWTDINSLYPFVMCGKFPGPLEDFGDKLAEWGIATVTIQAPQMPIAVLPFRNQDGRILYPSGKFTGTYTIPEIVAADAAGYKIQKVHQCYGTNEWFEPYKEFTTRLYTQRLAAYSDAERLFFKLLMNNLYGRLGAGGVIGRSLWQTPENKTKGRPYGEKVLVEYQMPLADETNWCHAAYVTAYGRLELLKYLNLIGPDKLIYCDTDSTVFDCPGGKIPFPVGKELGEMKLESWESSCLAFAPKLYAIGKTWKAKGVPKHLAEKFIRSGTAQFDMPFKFREAVTFFDRSNAKRLSVWRKVTKARETIYDRKKLRGNRFFPCKVNAA